MSTGTEDKASDILLDHRTKGIPGGTAPFPLSRIGQRGWNALRGDMPLPLAILKESVLSSNAEWITAFAARAGVSLCPHGKTTMCPQIFRRQLAGSAWGITLSTAHQVQVARDFGVSRILLANQLIDPAFIDYVAGEVTRDPSFDFYCLVDSLEGVEILRTRLARTARTRPVQVLLEVGMSGGRTGCRTLAYALDVARAAHAASLALRGIEGFEGIVPFSAMKDPSPIHALLDFMGEAATACAAEGLFAPGEAILSAGGSAYFDIVASRLAQVRLGQPQRVVLRSGCYISHDSDMYVTYFDALTRRSALARGVPGGLTPALGLLAYVQSRPEPTLALLTAGRRDCSYDHHLPKPLARFRPGRDQAPSPLNESFEITTLNDQHAYMRLPADAALSVGDIVILGVSHPCTTFDKWDVLYGVDDAYNVVSAFKTFF